MRRRTKERVHVEEDTAAGDTEHTVTIRRLGGETLGCIGCRPTDLIRELKTKLEQTLGLDAETLTLYRPSSEKPLGEHESVGSCEGLPAELYAVTLQTIELCAIAGVAASDLTDTQLEKVCSSPEAQGDIIILTGCRSLHNMSCLQMLAQMQVRTPFCHMCTDTFAQVLDVTGCNGGAATTLVAAITQLK